MANIGHVNPNLVGSTSLQLQLYQSVISKTFQDLKTGPAGLPFSRHLLIFGSFSLRPIGASNHPTDRSEGCREQWPNTSVEFFVF